MVTIYYVFVLKEHLGALQGHLTELFLNSTDVLRLYSFNDILHIITNEISSEDNPLQWRLVTPSSCYSIITDNNCLANKDTAAGYKFYNIMGYPTHCSVVTHYQHYPHDIYDMDCLQPTWLKSLDPRHRSSEIKKSVL